MRIGIDLLSERGTRGGIHTYTNELLRQLSALSDASSELELVIFAHKDYQFLFGLEKASGIQIVHTRWKGLSSLQRRVSQEISVPGLARKHGIDCLHSINNVLPSRVTTPSVLTVHDLSPYATPNRFGRWKHRYLSKRVPESIRRATKVISVSHSTRTDILTWVPEVPAEKVVVAPNGAGTSFGEERCEENERRIRSHYGLPDRFLLHVSLVERGKNLEAVCHALALLKQRNIITPLVIVGAPTGYVKELRKLWHELDLSRQVHYVGSVPGEDLPHFYRMARAFVFPSHYEGFGLPVLEAFACGTPTITSTKSSLPEVAGKAALIVPPQRPELLMKAIQKLWVDDGLHALLRLRGLERRREFSWEQTARKTLQVYLEVGEVVRATAS